MDKIEASIQHVSIVRIKSIYLIGVLYEFDSDNQAGTLDMIIKGNNLSFGIDDPTAPREARTAIATMSVRILSEADPIPVFNVNKGGGTIISVPVFSPRESDYLNIAGELGSLGSSTRQTLSLTPRATTGLPPDVIAELGIVQDNALVAREWGWRGW